jgi:hypothetical protein
MLQGDQEEYEDGAPKRAMHPTDEDVYFPVSGVSN